MRILITGGTGFIGKSLLKVLKNQNFKILVSSRKSYKKNFNISYTKQDMGKDLNSTIKKFNPEILIHLAWQGIPDFSLKTCNANIKKNIFFLDNISNLTSLKKIIITGSCLEYGSHNGICKEDFYYKPDSYFSYSKNVIKEFMHMICTNKNIDYVWLRLFYVYGLNQRKNTIIQIILDNLFNKSQIKINNPNATNDYVYIDDVVDAIMKSIKKRKIKSVINIGSGKIISVIELIRKIENMLLLNNKFSKKIFNNKKIKKQQSKKSLNLKAKRLLNWTPKYTLDEGLLEILKKRKLIK